MDVNRPMHSFIIYSSFNKYWIGNGKRVSRQPEIYDDKPTSQE